MCQQANALREGLSKDKPVEWVTMGHSEAVHGDGMLSGDVQQLKTGSFKFVPRDFSRKGHVAAPAELDGNFPKGNN